MRSNSYVKHKQLIQGRQKFKAIVQNMVKEHNNMVISLNEAINLLAGYDIQFSSPDQFKKFGRLFSQNGKRQSVRVIFGRLQLKSIQRLGSEITYMITVSQKLVQNVKWHPKEQPEHQIQECLRDYYLSMSRRYGKDTNWFKVIGGLTIGMSINFTLFELQTSRILSKSIHSNCSKRIAEHFQEKKGEPITWPYFMKTINEIPKNQLCKRYKTEPSLQQPSKTRFIWPEARQNSQYFSRNSFATHFVKGRIKKKSILLENALTVDIDKFRQSEVQSKNPPRATFSHMSMTRGSLRRSFLKTTEDNRARNMTRDISVNGRRTGYFQF